MKAVKPSATHLQKLFIEFFLFNSWDSALKIQQTRVEKTRKKSTMAALSPDSETTSKLQSGTLSPKPNLFQEVGETWASSNCHAGH